MGPSAPSRHRTAPHEGPSRPSQVHPNWPAQGTAVLASVVYTGFACSRTSGAWNRPAQPLRLPSLSHHGVSETRPRRCAQLFVSAACSITKAPPTLPPVDTGPVSALFLSRTLLPWTAVRWSFGGRTGLSSLRYHPQEEFLGHEVGTWSQPLVCCCVPTSSLGRKRPLVCSTGQQLHYG